MVRTMLESITDRSTVGVKRSVKKELESQQVTAINQFLKQSFYWNYLLNFNSRCWSLFPDSHFNMNIFLQGLFMDLVCTPYPRCYISIFQRNFETRSLFVIH